MSVVHIFFGAESTVPKFRKRLYGTTDLIANTGGILGLCLGFSILSGVEVLYFLTLRLFWKRCRKRMLRKRQQRQAGRNTILAQMLFQKPTNKVIKLNPNMIPVYAHSQMNPNPQPAPMAGWGNGQGHHFYGANSFLQNNVGVATNNAFRTTPYKEGYYY